jgi:fructoselysine-6-P-deglycase FrlB-like protein
VAHVDEELASQPECWTRAVGLVVEAGPALPGPGERVAVVGCGTSWFMAQAYAGLREAAGEGETDAFTASEFPAGRSYDRIVAITRSGTTTEVLDLLRTTEIPTTALIGDSASPAVGLADRTVVLPFADEKSVVQTRFATTALTLLRAHLGADLTGAIADARDALAAPLPVDPATTEQVTFLGRGWTIGLANEAALKCREAATLWTEAYPAMDYRHGPIAIARPGRLVWMFGDPPAGLAEEVEATGARFVTSELDPLVHLVVAQRVAVERAKLLGVNPDAPQHLTRSVVLSD